jgi:hypothetical protein
MFLRGFWGVLLEKVFGRLLTLKHAPAQPKGIDRTHYDKGNALVWVWGRSVEPVAKAKLIKIVIRGPF